MGSTGHLSRLVGGLVPLDPVERGHRDDVLAWLSVTDDVYRRVPPRTPSTHLVSYVLLHDVEAEAVLLVDHRRAGLWLPAGGHVEPGEDPLRTARREAYEELGFELGPDDADVASGMPFFLTVTRTVGPPETQHDDVSLWYAFACSHRWSPQPDPRELAGARWWTRAEVAQAAPQRFDPHLGRALAKLWSQLT